MPIRQRRIERASYNGGNRQAFERLRVERDYTQLQYLGSDVLRQAIATHQALPGFPQCVTTQRIEHGCPAFGR